MLVAIVAILVSLRRPHLGRRLLTVCCLLVGLVALYSYWLLRRSL